MLLHVLLDQFWLYLVTRGLFSHIVLLTIVVLKLFQIKLPGGEMCENHVNQNDVDAMLPGYSR